MKTVNISDIDIKSGKKLETVNQILNQFDYYMPIVDIVYTYIFDRAGEVTWQKFLDKCNHSTIEAVNRNVNVKHPRIMKLGQKIRVLHMLYDIIDYSKLKIDSPIRFKLMKDLLEDTKDMRKKDIISRIEKLERNEKIMLASLGNYCNKYIFENEINWNPSGCKKEEVIFYNLSGDFNYYDIDNKSYYKGLIYDRMNNLHISIIEGQVGNFANLLVKSGLAYWVSAVNADGWAKLNLIIPNFVQGLNYIME